MVWDDMKPTRHHHAEAAIENAIKVHMAMGGSTNAIIHVIAMARRAGDRAVVGEVRPARTRGARARERTAVGQSF
jgi:dihydroxyacid dehydratase/phosphogluconate dehydratase